MPHKVLFYLIFKILSLCACMNELLMKVARMHLKCFCQTICIEVYGK